MYIFAETNKTKRVMRKAIERVKRLLSSQRGKVVFPYTITLESIDGDKCIDVNAIEYSEAGILYIYNDNNAYDAVDWVIVIDDWLMLEACISETISKQQSAGQVVIPIYAVALLVSTDSCCEHWEDVVVTPFYTKREQAEAKYNEMIKMTKKEREELVFSCAVDSFSIVEEELDLTGSELKKV